MTLTRKVGVAVLAAAAVFTIAGPAEARAKPPASCVAALADADDIHEDMIVVLDAQDAFFVEMRDSATANASGGALGAVAFINDLTAATNTLTGKIDDLFTTFSGHADSYRRHAAKCRAGR